MSLISKIQSLISSANAVTGESRTDLTACVQDLKDGYGGSTVEKGLVFSEYDSDGYPHKAEVVGMTVIPIAFFMAEGSTTTTFCQYITTVKLPDGLTTIMANAFRNKYLTSITIPQGVTSIQNSAFSSSLITELTLPSSLTAVTVDSFGGARYLTNIIFLGDITAVARYSFELAGKNTPSIPLTIDFSRCTGVPTLENTNAFYDTGAKVFKVPSALLSEWQTATNWVGVTNVTWQGV